MVQVMEQRKIYILLFVIRILPLNTKQFTNFTCFKLAKAVLGLYKKGTDRNQHLGFQP